MGATQNEEAEVEADHAGEEAGGGRGVAEGFGPVRELTDAAGSPDAARSRRAGGSVAGCRAAETAFACARDGFARMQFALRKTRSPGTHRSGTADIVAAYSPK